MKIRVWFREISVNALYVMISVFWVTTIVIGAFSPQSVYNFASCVLRDERPTDVFADHVEGSLLMRVGESNGRDEVRVAFPAENHVYVDDCPSAKPPSTASPPRHPECQFVVAVQDARRLHFCDGICGESSAHSWLGVVLGPDVHLLSCFLNVPLIKRTKTMQSPPITTPVAVHPNSLSTCVESILHLRRLFANEFQAENAFDYMKIHSILQYWDNSEVNPTMQ